MASDQHMALLSVGPVCKCSACVHDLSTYVHYVLYSTPLCTIRLHIKRVLLWYLYRNDTASYHKILFSSLILRTRGREPSAQWHAHGAAVLFGVPQGVGLR